MAVDGHVSDWEVVSGPPPHPLAVRLDVCLAGSRWLHLNALCWVLIRTNAELSPPAQTRLVRECVAFWCHLCFSFFHLVCASSNASDVVSRLMRLMFLCIAPSLQNKSTAALRWNSRAPGVFLKLVRVCSHICASIGLYSYKACREYLDFVFHPQSLTVLPLKGLIFFLQSHSIKGESSPKKENPVTIYSPLCCSKPTCCSVEI